jgi:inhibitor of KinA sporulation pathway (predicted exonuclease)
MLSSLTGSSGLAMYGIQAADNPFDRCRSYLNIKTLMALKHKFSREIGMSKALNFYNETLEGRHHNGADDAFNIAKITAKVLS